MHVSVHNTISAGKSFFSAAFSAIASSKFFCGKGQSWETVEVTITRRKSVSGNADRLAILNELDVLRLWAKENPPDGGRVVLAGIAKPKSKSASGTEDFALTLRVEQL